MIVETKKRMYFIEYIPKKGREKDTDSPPTVRLNTKTGILHFGMRTLSILGMEGKFIKFYSDVAKRQIAFTLTDKLTDAQLASKKYRMVNVKHIKAGSKYTVSVAGITKQFGDLKEISYKCEIMKYVEKEGFLTDATYYYIEISEHD